jgi:hypothetical protein
MTMGKKDAWAFDDEHVQTLKRDIAFESMIARQNNVVVWLLPASIAYRIRSLTVVMRIFE